MWVGRRFAHLLPVGHVRGLQRNDRLQRLVHPLDGGPCEEIVVGSASAFVLVSVARYANVPVPPGLFPSIEWGARITAAAVLVAGAETAQK